MQKRALFFFSLFLFPTFLCSSYIVLKSHWKYDSKNIFIYSFDINAHVTLVRQQVILDSFERNKARKFLTIFMPNSRDYFIEPGVQVCGYRTYNKKNCLEIFEEELLWIKYDIAVVTFEHWVSDFEKIFKISDFSKGVVIRKRDRS